MKKYPISSEEIPISYTEMPISSEEIPISYTEMPFSSEEININVAEMIEKGTEKAETHADFRSFL